MRSPALVSQPTERGYIGPAILSVLVLFIFGIFSSNPLAYMFVLFATVLPIGIWLNFGATGIPIFPAVSALYFVYYGLPILRGAVDNYDGAEIQRGAVTVAGFLMSATLAWFLIGGRRVIRRRGGHDAASDPQVKMIVILGLSAGIFYYIAQESGWLWWLGFYIGVLRSVALTFASVACYLLGYARARGTLKGALFIVAVSGVIILVVLAWASLFLVGGVLHIAAALLGYILTKKKIPWITIVTIFALATVLHAGKDTMRKNNWFAHSQVSIESSITNLPSMIVEWIGTGIEELVSGNKREGGLIERTSLLHMLLYVQHATPESIPYLGGKTYVLMLSTLTPRFVDSEKISSQSGLNYLSIRYGLQTQESARNTTIAWGIPAEAFANFGYSGIIGAGLVFGALCALFTRISVGVSPISFPMLIAISTTVNLLNIEANFGYLLLNIGQSVVSVFLFFLLLKLFRRTTPSLQGAPLYSGTRARHTRYR